MSVVNLTPEDEKNQRIRDKFILEDVPKWIDNRKGSDEQTFLIQNGDNVQEISTLELRNNQINAMIQKMNPQIEKLKEMQNGMRMQLD